MASASVNANFGLCVLTDTSRTITVTHTYTAPQTLTGGASFGAAITSDIIFTDATYDIGKTGATRPRDGFFSRNVAAGGTLGVTGLATLTGGVVAGAAVQVTNTGQLFYSNSATTQSVYQRFSNTSGDLILGLNASVGGSPLANSLAYSTCFGSITSTYLHLGTNNTVQLTIDPTGIIILAKAASKIVPGVTSLSLRNNTDSADNLLITDAGNVTIRGTVNGMGISTGGLTFASANASIVPGATSFLIRNNANSTTNFTFSDSGVLTCQGSVNVVLGTVNAAAGTTANASVNIPHGVAPTSPVNGDMWSTTTTLNFRLNGVTKTVTLT